MSIKDAKIRHCDFCDKSEHEVRKLVAGVACFICEQCIIQCCIFIMGADNPKVVPIKPTDSTDESQK